MITATLIPDEALDDFTGDSELRFLHLAKVARRNLEVRLNDESARAGFSEAQWRAQYIHELAAAADALGIGGLLPADKAESTPGEMARFDVVLARILTRIRVSKPQPSKAETVALSIVTKANIQSDLEKLRVTISAAAISDELKAALQKKIDAVEAELQKARFNLHPLWLLTGAVSLLNLAGTGVGILADAKPATEYVDSIKTAVLAEKTAEEAEQNRLLKPVLQLESNAVMQLTDQSGYVALTDGETIDQTKAADD